MKLSRVPVLGVLAPLAIAGGVLVATTAGGDGGAHRHISHGSIQAGTLTQLDAAPLPVPLPSPLPTLPDPDGLPTCC